MRRRRCSGTSRGYQYLAYTNVVPNTEQRDSFANLARGLAPGARVVLVAWCPPIENEWAVVPIGAALAQLRDAAGQLPPPGAPGSFRYGDPAPLVASLEHATDEGVRMGANAWIVSVTRR